LSIWEGGALHLLVQLNADGTFSVYRGYNNAPAHMTFLGTSVAGMLSNTWAYVEFKWIIDPTAGIFQIRSNHLTIFNYSGTTQSSDNGSYTTKWTSVRLQQMRAMTGTSLLMWMNDFYLCDLQGSGDQLRDFLGDQRVQLIMPNGVGNVTGWTGAPAPNWDAVNESGTADDDTAYVTATAINTRDSYTFTDLPAGTVPLGFQTVVLARKDSDGTSLLAPTFRQGGTTYDATAQGVASASQYLYKLQPYDRNPATSARITAAEVNAAEFGVIKTV